MGATLAETIAALAIQSTAIAALAGLCAASVSVAVTAAVAADAVRNLAHVEHLIDSAAARAGRGPGARLRRPDVGSDRAVELPADLDSDGRIDASSKEYTAVELGGHDADTAHLRFRIGNQSISIGPAVAAQRRMTQGLVEYPSAPEIATHWFAVPFANDVLVATAERRIEE